MSQSRTSLANLAEAAVVLLAMAGNDTAFSEIVARRHIWLRNLLRRLSGNAALADDLAQQAFVQAWKSIRTLKSAEAFAGWLRQIAVNCWLQEVRKTKAATVGLEDVQHLPAAGVGSESVQIDLDRALALLKENERLCIVLSYNEGLSHGEIAALADMPLGTVKSHVARGAERMRELLSAYGGVR